jgi:hypothetical protein
MVLEAMGQSSILAQSGVNRYVALRLQVDRRRLRILQRKRRLTVVKGPAENIYRYSFFM